MIYCFPEIPLVIKTLKVCFSFSSANIELPNNTAPITILKLNDIPSENKPSASEKSLPDIILALNVSPTGINNVIQTGIFANTNLIFRSIKAKTCLIYLYRPSLTSKKCHLK